MPNPNPNKAVHYSLQTVNRIGDIAAADWDRCAGTENPFVQHAFLNALEESGSVGETSGWLPQHVILREAATPASGMADPAGTDRLIGLVPAYLKGHSYGEYVFDHAWADAYERAGGTYYPKLQVAIPYTPATGPRLLTAPDADPVEARQYLARGLTQVAEKLGLGSVHMTFAQDADIDAATAEGFLTRHDLQYHWHNQGYENFEDFLNTLTARKRKQIRKERRAIADAGIRVRTGVGDDITARDWDVFYRFYVDTYDRKWGYPYLTRDFFDRISQSMGQQIALIMADQDGTPIAGALNFVGQDTLFGRNWGCAVDVKYLHFETCYYQAIDVAIARGLGRIEAGTQGPHKIQRGYLPVRTTSAHWLQNDGFRAAVADFLERERHAIDQEYVNLNALSPYRNDKNDGGSSP